MNLQAFREIINGVWYFLHMELSPYCNIYLFIYVYLYCDESVLLFKIEFKHQLMHTSFFKNILPAGSLRN